MCFSCACLDSVGLGKPGIAGKSTSIVRVLFFIITIVLIPRAVVQTHHPRVGAGQPTAARLCYSGNVKWVGVARHRRFYQPSCSVDRKGEVIVKRSISVLSILAVLALFLFASACNTTKGFGKDVEKAGASMKNSAEKNGAE